MNKRLSRIIIAVGLGVVLGSGVLGAVTGLSGSLDSGSAVAYAAKTVASGSQTQTKTQSTATVTQVETQTVTPTITGVNSPPANQFESDLPSAQQLGLKPSLVAPLWDAYPSGAFELDTSDYAWALHVIPISSATIAGAITNLGWWENLFVAKVSILLLIWSFKMNLLSSAIGAITSYSQSVLGSLLGGPTLVIVTLLIGGWAVYVGLIKWQTARLFRGLLASIIVLGVALGYVPHLSQYITSASNLSNSLSGTVMSAIDAPLMSRMGSAGDMPVCESAGTHRICGYQKIPVPSTISNALTAAGNQLWTIEVVDPWMSLEFGKVSRISGNSGITLTSQEAQKIQTAIGPKPTFLGYAALLSGPLGIGAGWGLYQLDPTLMMNKPIAPPVYTGEQLPQLMLSYSASSPVRQAIAKALGDPAINHGNHPATVGLMNGANAWSRLGATIMATSLTGLITLVIATFAIEMTIAQVMVIVALLLGPIVLFVGIFPEIGFNIFLKWLKVLLGALFIRVLISAFLGVMFFALEILVGGQTYNNFFEPYLVGSLTVGAIWYLRRMLKQKGFGVRQMTQVQAPWAGAGAGLAGGSLPSGTQNPAFNPSTDHRPMPANTMRAPVSAREGSAPGSGPEAQPSRWASMASQIGDRAKGSRIGQKMGTAMGFDMSPFGGKLNVGSSASEKLKSGIKAGAKVTQTGARKFAGLGVANNPLGQSVARSLAQRHAGQMTAKRLQRHNASVAHQRSKGLTPFSAGHLADARRHLARTSLWSMDRGSVALAKARESQGLRKVGWGALAGASGVLSAGALTLSTASGALHHAHAGLRRVDEALLAPVANHIFGVESHRPQHSNASTYLAKDPKAQTDAPVDSGPDIAFPEATRPDATTIAEGVMAEDSARHASNPDAPLIVPEDREAEQAEEELARREAKMRENLTRRARSATASRTQVAEDLNAKRPEHPPMKAQRPAEDHSAFAPTPMPSASTVEAPISVNPSTAPEPPVPPIPAEAPTPVIEIVPTPSADPAKIFRGQSLPKRKQ